jgi:hypothetical protein
LTCNLPGVNLVRQSPQHYLTLPLITMVAASYQYRRARRAFNWYYGDQQFAPTGFIARVRDSDMPKLLTGLTQVKRHWGCVACGFVFRHGELAQIGYCQTASG